MLYRCTCFLAYHQPYLIMSYLFVHLSIFFFPILDSQEIRNLLVTFIISPQFLKQCLVLNRHLSLTKWINESFKTWKKGFPPPWDFSLSRKNCSFVPQWTITHLSQYSPVSPWLDHVHFKGMNCVLFIFVSLAPGTVTDNTLQVPTEYVLN